MIVHPEIEISRAGYWPAEGILCNDNRRVVAFSIRLPRRFEHRPNITIEVDLGDGWETWFEVPKVPRQFERSFSVVSTLRTRLAVAPPFVANCALPVLLPEPIQVNITRQ